MPIRDTIVVGASAGGVEALERLMAGLPADLPAAVVIVLHTPPTAGSALPAVLGRAGRLPVQHARDRMLIETGHVYVAPPDRHLLIHDGILNLSNGPRENGHRPAVDTLFRSASEALGSQVIGVILSGTLDDGAAGLSAVKSRGGLTLVQEPSEAAYPDMPRNAIRAVKPDHVVRLDELVKVLTTQAGTEVAPRLVAATPLMRSENAVTRMDPTSLDVSDYQRSPAGLSCPDCQGSLFEIDDGGIPRYRCRVGHAWSSVSLLAAQDGDLEHALWMALRSLEERVALCRRMAAAAVDRGSVQTADRYQDAAEQARRATGTLRKILLDRPASIVSEVDEAKVVDS
jgi:two-component system chemotaxis response regulator CheB